MIWIKDARYMKDFEIEVTFNDGKTFRIDLKDHLTGDIFSALKETSEFSKFRVHPELDTLAWESGADFAPEYLYSLAQVQNRQRT